jgi:hypothetical protein
VRGGLIAIFISYGLIFPSQFRAYFRPYCTGTAAVSGVGWMPGDAAYTYGGPIQAKCHCTADTGRASAGTGYACGACYS